MGCKNNVYTLKHINLVFIHKNYWEGARAILLLWCTALKKRKQIFFPALWKSFALIFFIFQNSTTEISKTSHLHLSTSAKYLFFMFSKAELLCVKNLQVQTVFLCANDWLKGYFRSIKVFVEKFWTFNILLVEDSSLKDTSLEKLSKNVTRLMS